LRDQAEVWACDIDPVVLTHSCSDRQIVVEPTALPFPDNHFDMIVSDWVFEHIERPARVCPEIVRVLKPGGLIFARTPRRWGYPAIAARLIPERLHLSVLRWAQPTREPRDVFRAHYRLNTLAAARAYFRGCAVSHYLCGLSPAYFPVGQDLARTLHVLFPHMLATAICFVIEKPTAQ
jgi:SAM-dependent methyltransferase